MDSSDKAIQEQITSRPCSPCTSSSEHHVETPPKASSSEPREIKEPIVYEPWECRWEAMVDATWTFLLMHDHVRLTVQLPQSYSNVPFDDVPSECPIPYFAFEVIPGALRNSMTMCVVYAVEAMRAYIPKVGKIGDLPSLLQHCCEIARIANRWVRTVHSHYYNLDYKGAPHQLVFKVANISFNCEWTVTMSIKKEVDETGTLCPVVDNVQVTSDTQGVPDVINSRKLRILRQRVARNWGHVPFTLWIIFKHLKYLKKRPQSAS